MPPPVLKAILRRQFAIAIAGGICSEPDYISRLIHHESASDPALAAQKLSELVWALADQLAEDDPA